VYAEHQIAVLDAEGEETTKTIDASVTAYSDCIKVVVGPLGSQTTIYIEHKEDKTGICIVANDGDESAWVYVDPTADDVTTRIEYSQQCCEVVGSRWV
jgi:hypothetical protein